MGFSLPQCGQITGCFLHMQAAARLKWPGSVPAHFWICLRDTHWKTKSIVKRSPGILWRLVHKFFQNILKSRAQRLVHSNKRHCLLSQRFLDWRAMTFSLYPFLSGLSLLLPHMSLHLEWQLEQERQTGKMDNDDDLGSGYGVMQIVF